MTLKQIVLALKHISLKQRNVRSFGEGDLYAFLASPKMKYAVMYLTQNIHQSTEQMDRYSFNFFYLDRQENKEATNALQIQSIGKQLIDNVLAIFCETYDSEIYGITTYQSFRQDHPDLLAGIYAVVTLEVPKEVTCPELYDEDEMEEQYNG